MVKTRYLTARIRSDLHRKMVILTGPRQAGKTTLAKSLMGEFARPQYLNWDVAGDRRILAEQAWSPRADLLVLDEIHKLPGWKTFLKGAWDGRRPGQALLVTGSARMETFRQTGASLAGRYFALRLHPFSVRELHQHAGLDAETALERVIERGGFPEPCLAGALEDADRWRNQYTTDLVREDVLEFSRVHEIRAMRLLVDLLRNRVGSPVTLSALARELQISPATAIRYVEILEALYVVFTVRPYHRNVARAILKEPKIYFFDTGLVADDGGTRFENACAAALLKHVHFLQDTAGRPIALHYIRDKEQHEIDFVLTENGKPSRLIECKHADPVPSGYFHRIAELFPDAEPILLVRELAQEQKRGRIEVLDAARWLSQLAA